MLAGLIREAFFFVKHKNKARNKMPTHHDRVSWFTTRFQELIPENMDALHGEL